MFCCTSLYAHSSIAIILMGKRELVALLNLSSLCLVMVEWLFLAVPWGCLRFVIMVFPDHTHLLFLVLFFEWSLKTDFTVHFRFTANGRLRPILLYISALQPMRILARAFASMDIDEDSDQCFRPLGLLDTSTLVLYGQNCQNRLMMGKYRTRLWGQMYMCIGECT